MDKIWEMEFITQICWIMVTWGWNPISLSNVNGNFSSDFQLICGKCPLFTNLFTYILLESLVLGWKNAIYFLGIRDVKHRKQSSKFNFGKMALVAKVEMRATEPLKDGEGPLRRQIFSYWILDKTRCFVCRFGNGLFVFGGMI
jgi:hypothetical protein